MEVDIKYDQKYNGNSVYTVNAKLELDCVCRRFIWRIIKYYKQKSKNKNPDNGKLGKVSGFFDNLIDVITGHINN